MSTQAPYFNTVIAPSGGVNALAGQGMEYEFTLSQVGVSSEVTIILTDQLTGFQTQVGFGNVTGIVPTYVKVFDEKVYILAGATTYFSGVDQPTVFDDPNGVGDSFIKLGNQVSNPENQVAIAEFQGLLAFIARRTVQTWSIDPDPTKNAKQQTLTNIGTFAKESVQAIGDNDVMMIYDSGIRSIRPRIASNNAEPIDVGTPVDALIQNSLVTLTDVEKAAANGTVEPTSNRYWCYIPEHNGAVGKIYVLSSFPKSEIEAWSTYSPTYQSPIVSPAANYSGSTVTYTGLTIGATYAWKPGANEVQMINGAQTFLTQNIFVATATTAVVTGNGATVSFTGALSQTIGFVPTKFSVFGGQVYALGGNAIYLYGGASNNSYDACGQTGQIPFLDCESASSAKCFLGMDAGFQGTWQFNFCGDYNNQTFKNVYNNTLSSFQIGNIPLGGRFATHFSLSFNEVGDGYARLSSAVVHFNPAAQKK